MGRPFLGLGYRGTFGYSSWSFSWQTCEYAHTIGSMKTVISAKLKLNTTPEQFAQLRATSLAYRDACNFVSKYAFEHGKMSNKVSLQEGNYDDLRPRFH